MCVVMGAGLSVAVRGSYSLPLASGLRRIGLVKTGAPRVSGHVSNVSALVKVPYY